MAGMFHKVVLFCAVLVTCTCFVYGLSCWHCGEYSDGVGSITPCLNSSQTKNMECKRKTDHFCIKYVSELSIVRDCVPECHEKESWGARTYCCNTDGCNAGYSATPAVLLITASIIILVFNII